MALTLLAATGASAQEDALGESDFAKVGVYAGVAGGVEIENVHDSPVDDSWAVDGWIGYRILPLLGLDLQAEYTTSDNLEGDSGGLEAIIWTANSRLYLASARFQPFALVGLGMSIGLEDEDSKVGNNGDVAMRAGGGLETHVTEGLSVVLMGSYVASVRANRHLDYASAIVGVQYQF
jgi:opacity protein-like surface antigen